MKFREKSGEPKAQTSEQRIIGNSSDMDRIFPGHTYLSAWSSPEKFADHVEGLDPKKAWSKGSAWGSDEDFTGTKSMAQALDMTRGNWKEGIELITKLRDRILTKSPLLSKPIKYGVVGAVPNVPRAVAGNPLNMKQPDMALSRRRPVITLVSNIGANCGVPAKRISNRAAVVAAIIDHIEAAGFACEIITSALSEGGSWSWTGDSGSSKFKAATVVTVKQSSHPVDIARLAFALGHASFFRRLVFADWCSDEINKKGLGSSLGHAYVLQHTEELNEKDIYVLPSAEEKGEYFSNEEKSMTVGLGFLLDSLIKQGCPAFPKELTLK